MKKALITLGAALSLTACGGKPAEPPKTAPPQAQPAAPNNDSNLGQEASKWVEQSKKLGSATWKSTKDTAGSAYEVTKEKSSEAWDTTKDATKEGYETTRKKSAEIYKSITSGR